MNEDIKEVMEAFLQFRSYKERYSGFYIYPGYEKDLNIILDFVETELMKKINYK